MNTPVQNKREPLRQPTENPHASSNTKPPSAEDNKRFTSALSDKDHSKTKKEKEKEEHTEASLGGIFSLMGHSQPKTESSKNTSGGKNSRGEGESSLKGPSHRADNQHDASLGHVPGKEISHEDRHTAPLAASSTQFGEHLDPEQRLTVHAEKQDSTMAQPESTVEQPKTWGDSILAGLHKPEASPTIAAPTGTNTSVSLPSHLADQILASVPSGDGSAEVRVMLKEAVLPDTEIRIQRTDNQLTITFVTDNTGSEQTILPHLRDLQSSLSQKFTDTVRVDVERPHDSSMGGNAQGDGRSRQQRNLFEEMAEQQTSRA